MGIYSQLASYPIFTIKDVLELTGNLKTSYTRLARLMKQGQVKKIRKNIYSIVNPTNGKVIASRYQIACAITEDAYLSHHSAFEYYGYINQVHNVVYVSSETKFNAFEFDQLTYRFISSKVREGIVEAKNTTGVRLTDLERTVIDSIRDVNKIGGLEELMKSLESIQYLDETKLLKYLGIYATQGLYQRVGYLLQPYRNEMQLSESFFDLCKERIGKSKRYLEERADGNCVYERDWQLMIPLWFYELRKSEGDILV